MRSKIFLIAILLCIGCAKSEKLDDNEMNYVRLTVALTNTRVASHDSVTLLTKFDSVYKKFSISKEGYKTKTTEFAKVPERARIVFQAIADSLNLK